MNRTYHTIVQSDKEILEQTSTYSDIYKIVKDFVDKYNLKERKNGSKLNFWVNIKCNGDRGSMQGYYFETSIKDNLIENIIQNIYWRFGSNINKLTETDCMFEIDKGL